MIEFFKEILHGSQGVGPEVPQDTLSAVSQEIAQVINSVIPSSLILRRSCQLLEFT